MTQFETQVLTLVITVLIEWLVLAATLRHRLAWLLIVCILINGLTQPIASWIIQQRSEWATLALVEAGVVAVEAPLLAVLLEINPKRAAGLSMIANSASAFIGVAIFWLR